MLMGALMRKKYPLKKYLNVGLIRAGVGLFMGGGGVVQFKKWLWWAKTHKLIHCDPAVCQCIIYIVHFLIITHFPCGVGIVIHPAPFLCSFVLRDKKKLSTGGQNGGNKKDASSQLIGVTLRFILLCFDGSTQGQAHVSPLHRALWWVFWLCTCYRSLFDMQLSCFGTIDTFYSFSCLSRVKTWCTT